jgi:hypothetical protein
LTEREHWFGTPIERAPVIDQAIPPVVTQTVTQTAEDVLEIAKDAIEGVREWASDAADRALEKVNPQPKKRSKLPLLLVLVGLGALAFFIARRLRSEAESVAPDTFGAAVEAERDANSNGERAPLRTSGA